MNNYTIKPICAEIEDDDFLQTENREGFRVCMECGDSITNPVCHECLQKQLESWLADKQISKKLNAKEAGKIKVRVKTLIKKLWTYPETGISCVFCREDVAICPYCFSRHIQTLLATKFNLNFLFSSFSFSFLSSYSMPAGWIIFIRFIKN